MSSFIDWIAVPPGSTIFILCLSFTVSLGTSLVNRRFVDRKQLNSWNREISNWRNEFNKARKSNDKKLLAKAQKQESRIMALQGKLFRQQMKPSLISMGPILLIWLLFTGRIFAWQLFTTPFTSGGTVAFIPWLDGPTPLSLIYWYILCSITSSTMIQKLLGISVGATR
jgi:uncharacterized membrane protein (DUF106 family)